MALTPQIGTNIYILRHCKIIIGIDIFNKKQYPYRLRHWLQGYSILANELIVSPYGQKSLFGTYIKDSYNLLEIVRKEPDRYHFIEIMDCPGGCIGGGRQPYAAANSIPLDTDCHNLLRRAVTPLEVQRQLIPAVN